MKGSASRASRASPGKSNAMRICTEDFTVKEVQLIQDSLLELYNIKTSRNKKKL